MFSPREILFTAPHCGEGVTTLFIKELPKSLGKLWLAICSIMLLGGTILMPVQTVGQDAKESSPFLQTSSCCEFIDIDYYVTEDCCVQIDIHNPHCDSARITILYFNPHMYVWQSKHIAEPPNSNSVSYKLCPSFVSSTLKFQVWIHNQYTMQPDCDSILVEGVNKFTYEVDISHCCACGGAYFNSWFTATKTANSQCPDSCEIVLNFNIPDSITCLKYYAIEPLPQGEGHGALANETISGTRKCLGPGEKFNMIVRLLASPEEYETHSGCWAHARVICDTLLTVQLPEISPSCWNDCDSSNEQRHVLNNYLVPECQCEVNVEYVTRTCDGLQQIQVLAFWSDNTWWCSGCPDSVLYMEALKKIIYDNEMQFKPLEPDSCDTTWEIGISSCWGTYIYYEWIMKWQEPGPSGPGGWVEVLDTVVVRIICDTLNCCFKKITVCRDTNSVTIQVDSTYGVGDFCFPPLQFPPLESPLFCAPACNWLDSLEGDYQPLIIGKQVLTPNYYQVDDILVRTYLQHEKFNIEFESARSANITISLYDYLGNAILSKTLRLSSGVSNYSFDLTPLVSGTYVYTISFDNRIIKSDKFIYIK